MLIPVLLFIVGLSGHGEIAYGTATRAANPAFATKA